MFNIAPFLSLPLSISNSNPKNMHKIAILIFFHICRNAECHSNWVSLQQHLNQFLHTSFGNCEPIIDNNVKFQHILLLYALRTHVRTNAKNECSCFLCTKHHYHVIIITMITLHTFCLPIHLCAPPFQLIHLSRPLVITDH